MTGKTRQAGECPVPGHVIRHWRSHAFEHRWPGNQPLTCPRHLLDTEAILEPGRPIRALLSFDVGYHASGWFKNSEYEQCLHLSLSHPRGGRGGVLLPGLPPTDLETPSGAEMWEWALLIFGPEHAPKAWIEPAVGLFDPYRLPNIIHARLYYDADMHVIMPEGEVYSPLRPWSEKVLGSLGGDVS